MSRTPEQRKAQAEARQVVGRLRRAYMSLAAAESRNELNAHMQYLWDRFMEHPSPDVLEKFGDRWGRKPYVVPERTETE